MTTKSPDGTPSVLFVCIHNAGRSQMAAGWPPPRCSPATPSN